MVEETPFELDQPHYKKRSAWIAVLLTILCPGLGHLYVGKLKKAVIFFVVLNSFVVLYLIALLLSPFEFFLQFLIAHFIGLALYLYLIIDVVFVAKKQGNDYVLKSYNKWYVYISIIIFILFVHHYYESSVFMEVYTIPVGSMHYTLLVGDYVVVNMYAYGIHVPFTDNYLYKYKKPGLNELVVFLFPGTRDEIEPKEKVNYIKRIVSKPGDIVQIRNKTLYVNDILQENPSTSTCEPRMMGTTVTDPRIFPKGSGWNEDNYGPIRVPKIGDTIIISRNNYEQWKIFVKREGHHIQLSRDSVIFIDAKQSNHYIVERDYYFVLGDSRNNSLDSRFWGFLPEENVIGKASYVYWSWDMNIPLSKFDRKIASIRWERVGKELR